MPPKTAPMTAPLNAHSRSSRKLHLPLSKTCRSPISTPVTELEQLVPIVEQDQIQMRPLDEAHHTLQEALNVPGIG